MRVLYPFKEIEIAVYTTRHVTCASVIEIPDLDMENEVPVAEEWVPRDHVLLQSQKSNLSVVEALDDLLNASKEELGELLGW